MRKINLYFGPATILTFSLKAKKLLAIEVYNDIIMTHKDNLWPEVITVPCGKEPQHSKSLKPGTK